MKRRPLPHRLIGSLVLISISIAGLFGPSLHALVHFNDGDSSGAVSSCGCSCCCVSQTDAPADEGTGAVGEDHDCAICRYLALSKQVDDCTVAVEVAEAACSEVYAAYVFEPCRFFRLRSAPRGPPSIA